MAQLGAGVPIPVANRDTFCCGARVRLWHKADIERALRSVRFWGNSGHGALP
jgi:hypothetical protein